MGTVLLGVGAASFVGYLIWLIVCAVRWDSKIPPIIGMALSLVMIAGGLSMTPRFMAAVDTILSKTPLEEILQRLEKDQHAESGDPGGAEGIWYVDHELDEFQEPTDNWYITASSPFSGSFNDSDSSGAELSAELRVDQEGGVSFLLYQNGDSKLMNSYPDQTVAYKVSMRTPDGADHDLTGYMAGNGDRLSLQEEDRAAVLEALQGQGTIDFYIEEAEPPARNFLFSVETDNFSSIYQAQTGG